MSTYAITHQNLVRRLRDVHPDDLPPSLRRLRAKWIKDGTPGLHHLDAPYNCDDCYDEGCDTCGQTRNIPDAEEDLVDAEVELHELQVDPGARTEKVKLRLPIRLIHKLRTIADAQAGDKQGPQRPGYKSVINQILREWEQPLDRERLRRDLERYYPIVKGLTDADRVWTTDSIVVAMAWVQAWRAENPT